MRRCENKYPQGNVGTAKNIGIEIFHIFKYQYEGVGRAAKKAEPIKNSKNLSGQL